MLPRTPTPPDSADEIAWGEQAGRAGRLGVVELANADSLARGRLLEGVAIARVLVDPTGIVGPEVQRIGATNWRGGYDAAHHLLDLGHTRVAYLGGDDDSKPHLLVRLA